MTISGPAALHDLLDFEPNLPQIDVEILEHIGRDAGAFLDQAEQNVFRADVLVVERWAFDWRAASPCGLDR